MILKNADRVALPTLLKPIFAFFLDVFDLRHRLQSKAVSQESINAVETSSIGSFLELVTKLNEASFKPLFVRLYDWAVVDLSEGKKIDDGRLIERRTVLLHVMMGLLAKFKVGIHSYRANARISSHLILEHYNPIFKSCWRHTKMVRSRMSLFSS